MRFLYKILLLPILTTLLVVIMLDIQPIPALLLLNIAELLKALGSDPFWSWKGWTAIEAIATAFALVAVGLAVWQYHIKRRREEQQRQALRSLMSGEIEKNLSVVGEFRDALERDKRHLSSGERISSYGIRLPAPHRAVKEGLENQVGLYSMAFTASEIYSIYLFYDDLEKMHRFWSNIRAAGQFSYGENLESLHLRTLAAVKIGSDLLASLGSEQPATKRKHEKRDSSTDE